MAKHKDPIDQYIHASIMKISTKETQKNKSFIYQQILGNVQLEVLQDERKWHLAGIKLSNYTDCEH